MKEKEGSVGSSAGLRNDHDDEDKKDTDPGKEVRMNLIRWFLPHYNLVIWRATSGDRLSLEVAL